MVSAVLFFVTVPSTKDISFTQFIVQLLTRYIFISPISAEETNRGSPYAHCLGTDSRHGEFRNPWNILHLLAWYRVVYTWSFMFRTQCALGMWNS